MVKITRKSILASSYQPITIELELSSEEAEMFDFIWRYCGSDAMKGPQSIATYIPLNRFLDFRYAMYQAFQNVLNKRHC